ncbi:hypothetical protein AGRI_05742 [Alishewanella agri BL06]|jgi:hypothetical protein|uniref:Uncharacterized protein n=1 Tax=Alishewanella agri BL06 TaxID=1195246 RepID=I9DTV4_9ALTE|nr:hypothetical protein [Alishewanella agri]EIW89580.1 hypothetical protein AGRI_05742 [Alishewanella agri BL06]
MTKFAEVADALRIEYKTHKWNYLSFILFTFACFAIAYIAESLGIAAMINNLVGSDFSLSRQIRLAPLEHFAPTTIVYSVALLFLLVSCCRLVFGTNERVAGFVKQKLLNPIVAFFSSLCRAMIGVLLAVTLLNLMLDFDSLLWIFFLFSLIFPILVMSANQSMGKLLQPIEGLTFDTGFWGTRAVGLLMITIALLSSLGVYGLELIGNKLF